MRSIMSASAKFLCLCVMHTQGWFLIGKIGQQQEKNGITHSEKNCLNHRDVDVNMHAHLRKENFSLTTAEQCITEFISDSYPAG